ncbi:MAG TPA: DUF3800 domain-containing protein [Solirubrobacterales bacterium]
MAKSKARPKSKALPRRDPMYAFGFLDETGTLASPRDPFFAVGLLRCRDPYELQRPMQRIRDRKHFYDEIKWGKVSSKKLPILKILTDVFFSADASLTVFVTDKRKHDVIGRFDGQFGAYEALARQLVHASIRRGETMFLIADEYSTPPQVTFEENVRDYVNAKLRRRAVAGVCRMRSTGVDLLQLIDLILGAIVYEYKAECGIVGLADYKPKTQLLNHIKTKAGVDSFVGGYRDEKINVADYHN